MPIWGPNLVFKRPCTSYKGERKRTILLPWWGTTAQYYFKPFFFDDKNQNKIPTELPLEILNNNQNDSGKQLKKLAPLQPNTRNSINLKSSVTFKSLKTKIKSTKTFSKQMIKLSIVETPVHQVF